MKINSLIILFSILQTISFAQKTEMPNIIHILVDDVGYDDIGCFGSKDIKTPNIDNLAKEGMIFTQFYAPHPTCTPSRAAMLTGRYAMRMNNNTGLDVLWPNDTTGLSPKKEITLPNLLKKAGYKSALVGKWHLGTVTQYLPLSLGFDYFFGISCPNDHGPERDNGTGNRNLPAIQLYEGNTIIGVMDNNQLAEAPHLFVRKACGFLREQAKTKEPFYLQFANIETHTPWFIPKGFDGKSKIGAFGDAVEYLDVSVGILLSQLKELKMDKNTIIIFSSDNGPLVKKYEELEKCYGKFACVDTIRAKKHKLRDGKYQAKYEGGTKVSFIIKWPEVIQAGTSCNMVIDGTDLFTTMLAVAGLQTPGDRVIDGENILDIFKNPKTAKPVREVFYSMKGKAGIFGVRKGKWKLSVEKQKEWMISDVKTAFLYDLDKDPKETKDLSDKYPEIKKQLLLLFKEGEKNIISDKPLAAF